MNSKTYEDQHIKIEFEDDYLLATYKKGIYVNKDIGSKMCRERKRLSNNKSYPVLGDSTGVKYWLMSSRNSDMSAESFRFISHLAVVLSPANYLIVKLTWKYTIKNNPPPVPCKFFSNFDDAKKWLKTQMEEEKNNLAFVENY